MAQIGSKFKSGFSIQWGKHASNSWEKRQSNKRIRRYFKKNIVKELSNG